MNADLNMFNRIARAICTSVCILHEDATHESEMNLDMYRAIRHSACEIYAQLSAFYAAPKRSDFLKACGVWEPKDGDR